MAGQSPAKGTESRRGGRLLLVLLGFVLGAALGWYMAGSLWRWQHRLVCWPEPRGSSHYLLALLWAVSGGGLGAAFAAWDILAAREPSEEEEAVHGARRPGI